MREGYALPPSASATPPRRPADLLWSPGVHTVKEHDAGWSSSVARWAHNPEVEGSNPSPATREKCPQETSPGGVFIGPVTNFVTKQVCLTDAGWPSGREVEDWAGAASSFRLRAAAGSHRQPGNAHGAPLWPARRRPAGGGGLDETGFME